MSNLKTNLHLKSDSSSRTNKEKSENKILNNDTCYDSLHNSKFINDKNNSNKASNKENNFYLALKSINSDLSIDTFLLGTSEFSETNPNQTKEENISRYLHHPITKEINKVGNKLIRVKPKQNYDTIVHHPYISKYIGVGNIFQEILSSIKGNKENGGNFRYNGLFIHKKNNSSSVSNVLGYNANYDMHKNIYSNINTKTILATKNFSTTDTREKKNIPPAVTLEEVREIKKQIIYDDLEDLEEYKDIDMKKYFVTDNNNEIKSNGCKFNGYFSENSSNNGENNIPKKNEILVIDSFYENNVAKNIYNNNFYNNKLEKSNGNKNKNNDKTTTVKKLRKKYERTEFKKYIYYTNPDRNKYIDDEIEIQNKQKRKTTEASFKRKFCVKQKNKESQQEFTSIENSLSQLSININVNLLEHFNQCGVKRSSLKKINNNNSNKKNKVSPTAELIDFISNKSENENFNEKNNNNINNDDDTFIINDTDNNLNINIDISNNDIYEEQNESGSKNGNNKINYDYLSPDRNPNAIVRPCFLMKNILNKNNYITKSNTWDKNNNNNSLIKTDKNNSSLEISYDMQPQTIYDIVFYQNLLKSHAKSKKISSKQILNNHLKITIEERINTLLWMMQICEEFAYKRDTFHYSCYYFDHFIVYTKQKKINKKELELIGITCISISGKIEEVQIPKLSEYANSLSENFTSKDIIESEQKLCSSLNWNLISVNINTWLNWYTCQWDLYIDSVDSIKNDFLQFIPEEEIIYYKNSNDKSYYNYRKICQIIDLIVLDYNSYDFDSRLLVAASFFIIICINYKLNYDFNNQNFKQKTPLAKLLINVYQQFISQSFDYVFNDKSVQMAINYCMKFKNFKFSYELPLLYQIQQEQLENCNYEDFLSYQTTNDYNDEFIKGLYKKNKNKHNLK